MMWILSYAYLKNNLICMHFHIHKNNVFLKKYFKNIK